MDPIQEIDRTNDLLVYKNGKLLTPDERHYKNDYRLVKGFPVIHGSHRFTDNFVIFDPKKKKVERMDGRRYIHKMTQVLDID